MPPSGFNDAFATGVDNGKQVGYTSTIAYPWFDAGQDAMRWFGSARRIASPI